MSEQKEAQEISQTKIDFVNWMRAKGLSHSTMQQYLIVYNLLNKLVGERELSQEIVNEFIVQHPHVRTRAFLKNLFEFAEISDLKIPAITGAKKRVKRRVLSISDIKILRRWLYHNKPSIFLLLFDLTYFCALRREETIKIKVEDFDWDRWKTKPEGAGRLKITGKRMKDRIVIVPKTTMQRLVRFLKYNQDIGLHDRIFPKTWWCWNEAFKEAVKACLEHNFTLHDIRRARATHWFEQNRNLDEIKIRLGHKQITTTEIYVQPDEERQLSKWEAEY